MTNKALMKTATTCVATLALAAAFTVAPAAIGVGPMDDAAYAKDKGDRGNGRGGGGGRGGDNARGGGGKDKGDKARGGGRERNAKAGGGGLGKRVKSLLNPGQAKKQQRASAARSTGPGKVKPQKGGGKKEKMMTASADATTSDLAFETLHPSQKGRWNANPAQAAIDAHIRNQNFNGTVGMLSQYELALKAQDPEAELNDSEQSALDYLYGEYGIELQDGPADMDVSDYLNDTYGDGSDAIYSYEDGVVTCEGADCGDDLADIQNDADSFVETETDLAEEANAEARGDLLDAAEQRILDGSNKSTDGIEDPLLDNIAGNLGFDRQEIMAEAEELVEDPEEVIVPVPDEEIVLVTE